MDNLFTINENPIADTCLEKKNIDENHLNNEEIDTELIEVTLNEIKIEDSFDIYEKKNDEKNTVKFKELRTNIREYIIFCLKDDDILTSNIENKQIDYENVSANEKDLKIYLNKNNIIKIINNLNEENVKKNKLTESKNRYHMFSNKNNNDDQSSSLNDDFIKNIFNNLNDTPNEIHENINDIEKITKNKIHDKEKEMNEKWININKEENNLYMNKNSEDIILNSKDNENESYINTKKINNDIKEYNEYASKKRKTYVAENESEEKIIKKKKTTDINEETIIKMETTSSINNINIDFQKKVKEWLNAFPYLCIENIFFYLFFMVEQKKDNRYLCNNCGYINCKFPAKINCQNRFCFLCNRENKISNCHSIRYQFNNYKNNTIFSENIKISYPKNYISCLKCYKQNHYICGKIPYKLGNKSFYVRCSLHKKNDPLYEFYMKNPNFIWKENDIIEHKEEKNIYENNLNKDDIISVKSNNEVICNFEIENENYKNDILPLSYNKHNISNNEKYNKYEYKNKNNIIEKTNYKKHNKYKSSEDNYTNTSEIFYHKEYNSNKYNNNNNNKYNNNNNKNSFNNRYNSKNHNEYNKNDTRNMNYNMFENERNNINNNDIQKYRNSKNNTNNNSFYKNNYKEDYIDNNMKNTRYNTNNYTRNDNRNINNYTRTDTQNNLINNKRNYNINYDANTYTKNYNTKKEYITNNSKKKKNNNVRNNYKIYKRNNTYYSNKRN